MNFLKRKEVVLSAEITEGYTGSELRRNEKSFLKVTFCGSRHWVSCLHIAYPVVLLVFKVLGFSFCSLTTTSVTHTLSLWIPVASWFCDTLFFLFSIPPRLSINLSTHGVCKPLHWHWKHRYSEGVKQCSTIPGSADPPSPACFLWGQGKRMASHPVLVGNRKMVSHLHSEQYHQRMLDWANWRHLTGH